MDATSPSATVPSSEDAPQGGPLTRSQIFHLLQNQRRRWALVYLLQGDGAPVAMRELAEQVAAWEHDTTPEALDSDQRQRVYISLYQSHLPKLADHGIVDYDQDRGIVERLSRAEELRPYLAPEEPGSPAPAVDESTSDDSATDPVESWGPYYLALAVLGGILVVAGLAVQTVPVELAAVVTVAAVATVAAVDTALN